MRLAAWQTQLDKLADSKTRCTNESLTTDGLGDDYQKLFLNICLQHTRELVSAYGRHNFGFVTPLRIFFLGTAGSGKPQLCKQRCKKFTGCLTLTAYQRNLYAVQHPPAPLLSTFALTPRPSTASSIGPISAILGTSPTTSCFRGPKNIYNTRRAFSLTKSA